MAARIYLGELDPVGCAATAGPGSITLLTGPEIVGSDTGGAEGGVGIMTTGGDTVGLLPRAGKACT